jgi:ferrochelatase
MKKGLLLINLGTPDEPTKRGVRQYLSAFLIDKRVISLPALLRYMLLYTVILPFRVKPCAHAYQNIWTPEGSPLLVNSLKLQKKVQAAVGRDYIVSLGMRYGSPSIENALHSLQHCSHITILPLYPQYSSAATGSSIEAVLTQVGKQAIHPSLSLISDFHNHRSYIAAQVELIRPYLSDHEFVLFSYHGLPTHHLKPSGCDRPCENACSPTSESNFHCYRAQCFQTSRLLVNALKLESSQYQTAFQSRLGKTPWIKPYTDETLKQLAQQGIKRIAIACPSFVADCLETLEEIGIRAAEQWKQLGGDQLTLIPCLNDTEVWVKSIMEIVQDTAQ